MQVRLKKDEEEYEKEEEMVVENGVMNKYKSEALIWFDFKNLFLAVISL